jgi:2-dehydro-3-deoxy-D-arabinonate dehydratase
MRVYKTKRGIVVEKEKSLFLLDNQNWDTFINDDNLSEKLEKITKDTKP